MLKIVGDCNFTDGFFDTGFGVGSSVASGKDPFAKLNREKDDFWIGNFECVCADCTNLHGTHAKQFRIIPSNIDHIIHLDLYGVANNHVMQHGTDAYRQMLAYFDRKKIPYAGSNNNRTVLFEHQGKKVALTAFNQRPENFTKPPLYWAMPEYEELKAELSRYKNCDYRIVYVHWGVEFINYPYNDQKQLAHFLVECGADLIIGMHPHVMQGCEIYKGKHIFYSLGNCVFNMPWIPTKYSLLVSVDLITEKVTYQYLQIEKDHFPALVKSVPDNYTMEYLNALLDICEDNEIYFAKARSFMSQYRKANRIDIIKSIRKMRYSVFFSIMKDFIKRRTK